MEIIPNLFLFVDENENPDYYWMDVEIPSNENYEIVSHGEIIEDVSTDTFHVDVTIQPLADGEKKIEVLLEDLNAGSTPKTIQVNLVSTTESGSGTGTVSTESAEQDSRPITGDQLPD